MSFFLRVLIWLYRHSLSLLLGRQCRFMPTCSAYADEALRVHGTVKGGKLALKRLCRCHPLTKWGGGTDRPRPARLTNYLLRIDAPLCMRQA